MIVVNDHVMVTLDCGCTERTWRFRVGDVAVGKKMACRRHSKYLGPHPEDGLDVLLTDRVVVSVAPDNARTDR